MSKIKMFFTKRKIIIFILIVAFLAFIGLWNIVSGGYDKQNATILFIKKFIPSKIARKVRDTIFIIPDLKERNKFLSTQVRKYEQGLSGEMFNDQIIISEKNKKKYLLKEFFLPFPRLDTRLGWSGEKNSTRAHHLAIIGDNVIVISGEGKTIYFTKNNIFNDQLNEVVILNNIQDILTKNNFKLIGIRDLVLNDEKLYISLIFKNLKGYSINAYTADLNFEKLNFELFFETDEFWDSYNVFSGGRFFEYKDNKILFTVGYSNVSGAAQNLNSLLGKIISIDKQTKEHNIISMGHRNPQGLSYIKDSNIIINTEHGPKGGDEININFQKTNEIPNFGWDISSYGTTYGGDDIYKKSHIKYGFIEPFKYYVPSIGISQLVYMPNEFNTDNKKYLYVTSLRAGSIYVIQINENFSKIIDEDRIYFQQRIRDIEYDEGNDLFFLLFENTPSIGVLKLSNE